ncbi:tyrosine-specific transport protein-like protein isoform X1 [Tanacetum coccineum]
MMSTTGCFFPPLSSTTTDYHHKPPFLLLKFPFSHQQQQHGKSTNSLLLSSKQFINKLKCFSSKQKSSSKYEFDERLFSNVNPATLKRQPGSVTSSVLLVAGTTVGAGILAIPAVTQEAGFFAAAITCILCWIYMVVTGLLIAEVNVKTMCELGSGGVSLVSMATRTLGTIGVQIVCWSYIFIHYALLVAYVARSSDILTNILGIPVQQLIGAVNGVLVSGILISFAALVAVAAEDLHWDALLRANLQAIPTSIPIIALSFVYQNVVPVLCTNLEGDLKKIRTSVVLGTAIPLGLFLIWNAVILGTISTPETGTDKIADPLQALLATNEVVGPIVGAFSLLAIATSYIGFVLGLSDFLSDLLKLPSDRSRPLPYLLTLFPPLILSLLDPDIFFKALDFAGTYGVLVLFGILPAAMTWSDRYSTSSVSLNLPQLVPGGRFTLSLVIGGAGYVIITELIENFMRT